MLQTFPERLQGVLWSRDISKLDLQNDKIYIIHQIFCYGRMEDIHWLQRMYTKEELRTVFVAHPYKEYDAARFYFVKDFLLDLEKESLEEKLYVKNTPRNIG